jgi:hypothetical protein
VHTNGIENFWALLKRGLRETYVAVEPFHLDLYIDEQIFRFNNRGDKGNPVNDGDRFELLLSQVAGKRLTYSALTGKESETTFYPLSWEAWPEAEGFLAFRFLAFAAFSASSFSFSLAVRNAQQLLHCVIKILNFFALHF